MFFLLRSKDPTDGSVSYKSTDLKNSVSTESKHKYSKDTQKKMIIRKQSQIAETEMIDLMSIVNKSFNENILRRSRQVNTVNARMVFSKILRDRGCLLTQIGRFLRKDHSTIVNYMQNFDMYIRQDSHLMQSYLMCKEEFFLTHDPILSYKEEDLKKEILSLRSEINDFKLQEQRLNAYELKYSRLSELINLIDSRTPVGHEKKIKKRVERMFNE